MGTVTNPNSRHHLSMWAALVPLEEGPEGGRVLHGALQGGQHQGVVVEEVNIGLQLGGEPDKNVPEAGCR